MDALTVGGSALNAFAKKLTGTSGNLANSRTPRYKAVRVNMVEGPGGGVSGVVSRDLTTGPLLPREGLPGEDLSEGSNVDVAREMTDLVVTRRGYQANARAMAQVEETKGTILDIID